MEEEEKSCERRWTLRETATGFDCVLLWLWQTEEEEGCVWRREEEEKLFVKMNRRVGKYEGIRRKTTLKLRETMKSRGKKLYEKQTSRRGDVIGGWGVCGHSNLEPEWSLWEYMYRVRKVTKNSQGTQGTGWKSVYSLRFERVSSGAGTIPWSTTPCHPVPTLHHHLL